MSRQIINGDADLKGLTAVGKIRDAHGLKGELFVVFFAREAPWMEQVEELILLRNERDQEGKTIRVLYRFPRRRTKPHKIGSIMKVDGVEDRTAAEGFAGSIMYISDSLLTSQPGEGLFLREVDGFQVINFNQGPVGHVIGFSSNGAQDLLVIKTSDDRTVEIPFVEDFTERVDLPNKTIFMKFPEGLLSEQLQIGKADAT